MRLHMDDDAALSELPPDLQAVIEQIDAADRTGDRLAQGLTDEQLHWQPDGGRGWSVAQCLEHLATTNVVYGVAMAQGIAEAQANGWVRRGPAAPGFWGRRFLRSLEPPVTLRVRAPGHVRPGSQLSRSEIIRRYRDAHDRIRQLVWDAATIDTNRATFRNPFLRLARVKVSTGLHVVPAHDRRHLWQAEQVTLRRDFPRAAYRARSG